MCVCGDVDQDVDAGRDACPASQSRARADAAEGKQLHAH